MNNPEPSQTDRPKPAILAPAGSRASFLAALSAGADAVYCGLKTFSARMAAKNFKPGELAALTGLAHEQGVKVYVALNSMLKPGDLATAGGLVAQLERQVKPDALIIQDLAMVRLARQAGFSGELHLSTLANATFPAALAAIRSHLAVDRVVLPRELDVDEIKTMAAACPDGLGLEVFIHGALCYGVSGRCYWSSYYGGKSGLRGRCVQPCRRVYTQARHSGRFFSCRDLSLDVLIKVLMSIPQVGTWKIEGRKKGPHYVYYTVKAYQMLRDEGRDPQVKKAALSLLERALGRTTTHYHFLPQRPQNPVDTSGQTGSGLLVGKIQGSRTNAWLIAREALLPGDVLRIGYEDQAWHAVHRVGKFVPKKGRLQVRLSARARDPKGTPVFLTDRREKALAEMIDALDARLKVVETGPKTVPPFTPRLPGALRRRPRTREMHVTRRPVQGRAARGVPGLWLSTETVRNLNKNRAEACWWWLPPVVWPRDEADLAGQVAAVLKKGGQQFVLNAPWQTAFFADLKRLNLWAGPFCNTANPAALGVLAGMGFSGAMVSPELGREEYELLPRSAPLPLGMVVTGSWPLCISRTLAENLKTGQAFDSPKSEQSWVRQYGSNYWVYPNWQLDLSARKKILEKAGYALLVHLDEPLPAKMQLKKRPGLWNWEIGLA